MSEFFTQNVAPYFLIMNKLKLSILFIIIAFSIKAQDLPIISEMASAMVVLITLQVNK
jgi:hypothetical protein